MISLSKFSKFINNNKIPIFLFFLALLSGFFWNHRFYFQAIPSGGDQRQYSCLAIDMIENGTYTECGTESFLEPGYPLFLASIFLFSDTSPIAVRFVQLFIFGVIVVLIYFLSRRLFDSKVAFIAGLFTALHWSLANYTGSLIREVFLVFSILLLVYSLYIAVSSKKNTHFIISGLLFGVVALSNAIIEYFLLFIIINFIIILRKKIEIKQIFLKIGLFLFAFCLILSPWIVRNSLYYNKLVVSLTPKKGHILSMRAALMEEMYPNIHKYYFGHLFGYYFAEKVYPDLDIWAFRDFNAANSVMLELREEGYNLNQIDEIISERAVNKIITQPHKYVAFCILDFLNFNSPLIPQKIFMGNSYVHYTFAEGRFPTVPGYVKSGVLILFRIYWYTFLFLVIYGLCKNIKNWEKISWFFLIILYFNGVYSAVHALPRYAVQIYPFYIILASAGVLILFKKYKHKIKSLVGKLSKTK
ncbi:MAG: hypothetical protein GF349_01975 [Candidatus Magasanikbacteria bacterium]|nr:hypothetical protein [Candidatus Magasanikbacteria bacterium]